jgi:hypothetical protein
LLKLFKKWKSQSDIQGRFLPVFFTVFRLPIDSLFLFLSSLFVDRFPMHFDAMRVVHEPVEDGNVRAMSRKNNCLKIPAGANFAIAGSAR